MLHSGSKEIGGSRRSGIVSVVAGAVDPLRVSRRIVQMQLLDKAIQQRLDLRRPLHSLTPLTSSSTYLFVLKFLERTRKRTVRLSGPNISCDSIPIVLTT
jgi:hypothetical protein